MSRSYLHERCCGANRGFVLNGAHNGVRFVRFSIGSIIMWEWLLLGVVVLFWLTLFLLGYAAIIAVALVVSAAVWLRPWCAPRRELAARDPDLPQT